jgi:2,4-dienoyl-CoA reductase-like NADH-dependent reductase (Old Yellow Enzyme family)
MSARYRRVAQLKTPEAFAAHLAALGVDLPFDLAVEAGPASPLAQPYVLGGRTIGNRFSVLPMEGWDGTPDGLPSDLTRRRWRNFGLSGAKLVWGGEAVAVRPDGRANPNQLMITPATLRGLAELRQTLLDAHRQRHGRTDDLYLGLQLTHSGRFARPNCKDRLEPQILYAHPLLNPKFNLPLDFPVLTDGQIADLIGDFVAAGRRAQALGFDFVDLKHCHGYLGHEFLSAVDRPGRYGGSLENRTRFLREVVAGLRRDAPGLDIGVRLSAFDTVPFRPGPDACGVPEAFDGPYPYAFGGDALRPPALHLAETAAFLRLLQDLDLRLVCITAGSPYYNPHLQRPALFPPSDGYQPPEDPLAGVARQASVTAQLKAWFPRLAFVGSAYSYLQEWLPRVAQHNVRAGRVDFVGLGRMMLAYPELPADILAGRPLRVKALCRTFSDCTTAPRNGLVSGCFPLDPFYKAHPQHAQLMAAKRHA